MWQYELKVKMLIPIDTPFPPLGIYLTETLPQACQDTQMKRSPSALPLSPKMYLPVNRVLVN